MHLSRGAGICESPASDRRGVAHPQIGRCDADHDPHAKRWPIGRQRSGSVRLVEGCGDSAILALDLIAMCFVYLAANIIHCVDTLLPKPTAVAILIR